MNDPRRFAHSGATLGENASSTFSDADERSAFGFLSWPNLMMAAYGAGWSFTVPFIGQLYVAEIVSLMFLPFIGWRQTLTQLSSLRVVLAGYFLILLGLMLSDFANGTSMNEYLRGWANPLLAATGLVFFVSVLRIKLSSLLFFLFSLFLFKLIFGDAGYSLGGYSVDLSYNSLQRNTNNFKIRFIPFLIPLIILSAFYVYRFGAIFSVLICTAASVVFFIFDARAAGLVFFVSAILMFSRVFISRLSAGNSVLLLCAFLIFGQVGYVFYVDYSLQYNAYGHNARQLKKLDNPYNPVSLLALGRSEWTVAPTVIMDNPIFGHGSWALDHTGKYNLLRALKTDEVARYYYKAPRVRGVPTIPTHSVLTTSWIWGGFIGFIGFCVLFVSVLKNMKTAFSETSAYSTILCILFTSFFWDIFFSPFQAIRLIFPYYIGVILVISIKHQNFGSNNSEYKMYKNP
ncbi:MAG: hypothetical protein ACR2O3_10075 [Rhizobiaceae bacterium]